MANYNTAQYTLIYIFAIDDGHHDGMLKIGKTTFYSLDSYNDLYNNCEKLNQAANQRILQETKTAKVDYKLLHTELAIKTITMRDGSTQVISFDDFAVRDVIIASGYEAVTFNDSGRKSEWYRIDFENAKKAITAVKNGNSVISEKNEESKTTSSYPSITLRNEQEDCVDKTINWFSKYDNVLWDCKMRFGKTVTAYELIRRMNGQGKFKKTIVITHRPAVEDGWDGDHDLIFKGRETHAFIDKTNGKIEIGGAIDAENDAKIKELARQDKPFVYFASIQDLRGSARVKEGGFRKNNAVFDLDWNLIVIDEAHEGTRTDLGDKVITTLKKANTKILSLSGTPYNLISDYEENKYTWTYVDEQKAKQRWYEEHPNEKNPYEDLPVMNIYTFDLAEQLQNSYRYASEDQSFNFREFFRTWKGDVEEDYRELPEGARIGDFVHADDVWAFLSLISEDKPDSNYPYSTPEFRDMFKHTFWIVPGVAAAKALSAMLQKHPRFKDTYRIVNIAGNGDEEQPYDEALALVKSNIASFSHTISISCGKLTTGVTVREWTGVMMLSGSSSTAASGYMQAIFRVQSPGCIDGKQKKNCYVFDFAPDRTLKVIAEVHSLTHKGDSGDSGAKVALGEFLNFCPIIACEGTAMRSYDVPELMRQLKKISVDHAIQSGFDDDSIYVTNPLKGMNERDQDVLRQLSNVVLPQKKGRKQNEVVINSQGLTDEQRIKIAEAKKKKKKDLTAEDKELLEKEKKEREEAKKLYDLLRAVSIRLPLLFYGADADITEVIHLEDFVNIVDEPSWAEFMPTGLRKELFKNILKFYDEDIVVGAGLRIRRLAKAADELPPTLRAKRIVEILSKFKNPDKETVLTPWNVVNMHLGQTLGGYNFFDESYKNEQEEPRFIDNGDVTSDIFLNENAKILEMNSKSGLYPLYMAYSIYMLNINGSEKNVPFEKAQEIWYQTIKDHIFVLCKTTMAKFITRRTLIGYSNKEINAIYLPKLIDERMKDIPRLTNKLTNPATWGKEGDRMKFDAVVGNPPYQGVNHSQIYPYFYVTSIKLGKYVSLIFPVGWQQPKNANNLKMLNNPEIKEDKQIVKINNCQNVFPGISGAEWVNIIMWKKDYDNGLDGKQLVYTNGQDPKEIHLSYDETEIPKPKEIVELSNLVTNNTSFVSIATITSVLKPYGLRTDVIDTEDANIYKKYNIGRIYKEKQAEDDITIYAKSGILLYVPKNYEFPKESPNLFKHKVFVPYAWGNMSEKNGLGGAFSDIVVAAPGEACTETYLESGGFEDGITARKHAKYLMTKFCRALLYVNKYSQHSTSSWGAVPIQDYREFWWNDSIETINAKLIEKYNVPEHIARFINENIQTKDESNIVNFDGVKK